MKPHIEKIKKMSNNQAVKLSSTVGGQREIIREMRNRLEDLEKWVGELERKNRRPVDLGEDTTCIKCGSRYCTCPERRMDGSWESVSEPKEECTCKGNCKCPDCHVLADKFGNVPIKEEPNQIREKIYKILHNADCDWVSNEEIYFQVDKILAFIQ